MIKSEVTYSHNGLTKEENPNLSQKNRKNQVGVFSNLILFAIFT